MVEGDGTKVEFSGIDDALSIPDVQVRLFGKPEVHGHRRMGVVLAKGEDVKAALATAEAAYSKISWKVE